jgi:hypothetical protein
MQAPGKGDRFRCCRREPDSARPNRAAALRNQFHRPKLDQQFS